MERIISAEEREWARLKNEEETHKDRQKGIVGAIFIILMFFALYFIRSSLYSRLNTSTTVWQAIVFLGGGVVFLISGIYSTSKLASIRDKLSNMPNYSNRND